MTPQEQARRALKTYPAAWRREHGEALVGTLLDVAEGAGRDRLTRAEKSDLFVQGMSLRVSPILTIRSARLLGTAALIVGGALAVTAMILGEIAPMYAKTDEWTHQQIIHHRWGVLPIHTSGPVLYLVWIALLVAALRQRTRLARQLAVLTILIALTLPFAHHFFGVERPPLGLLAALMVMAALVAMIPWPGRDIATSAGTSLLLAAVFTAVTLPVVLDPPAKVTDGFRFYMGFDVTSPRRIPGFGYGELGGRIFILLVPAVVLLALTATAVGTLTRAISALRSSRRDAQQLT